MQKFHLFNVNSEGVNVPINGGNEETQAGNVEVHGVNADVELSMRKLMVLIRSLQVSMFHPPHRSYSINPQVSSAFRHPIPDFRHIPAGQIIPDSNFTA